MTYTFLLLVAMIGQHQHTVCIGFTSTNCDSAYLSLAEAMADWPDAVSNERTQILWPMQPGTTVAIRPVNIRSPRILSASPRKLSSMAIPAQLLTSAMSSKRN